MIRKLFRFLFRISAYRNRKGEKNKRGGGEKARKRMGKGSGAERRDGDGITFVARDGGSSTVLGSKLVVEYPVDGIATEMQMARDVKRKAAKDESFIVLIFDFFFRFLVPVLGGYDESRGRRRGVGAG